MPTHDDVADGRFARVVVNVRDRQGNLPKRAERVAQAIAGLLQRHGFRVRGDT